MSRYTPSPKVQHVLTGSGISADEFDQMVDKSALSSAVTGFNRKFHQWLFKVEGQDVLNMRLGHQPSIGQPRGQGFIFEECSGCGGTGCIHCGWYGEVKRYF